jgi:hypothetical protein
MIESCQIGDAFYSRSSHCTHALAPPLDMQTGPSVDASSVLSICHQVVGDLLPLRRVSGPVAEPDLLLAVPEFPAVSGHHFIGCLDLGKIVERQIDGEFDFIDQSRPDSFEKPQRFPCRSVQLQALPISPIGMPLPRFPDMQDLAFLAIRMGPALTAQPADFGSMEPVRQPHLNSVEIGENRVWMQVFFEMIAQCDGGQYDGHCHASLGRVV